MPGFRFCGKNKDFSSAQKEFLYFDIAIISDTCHKEQGRQWEREELAGELICFSK